jgi:Zn-dependent peptidase ImmA (M78 family)
VFTASRLSLARKRRGFTKKRLADEAEITVRSVTAYEVEGAQPSRATIDKFSRVLHFPCEFFEADEIELPASEIVSFRALKSMTASQRDAALGAAALAAELSAWIDERFSLPRPDLPDLAGHDPETAAEIVRATWGLGERPIRNMVHLLEAHGVRVFSLAEDCDDVDAFSFWRGGIPFVFLNTRKSGERGRFDAAHELGHLVMHRTGMPASAVPRAGDAERGAQQFGGAFLMPRASVLEVAPLVPTIENLIQLKRKWNVALAALAHRLHALNRASDWHYRTLCVHIARAGYRTNEPDAMERETSQVLDKVLMELLKEGTARLDVARALRIDANDLEALVFGLIGPPPKTDESTARSEPRRAPDLRLISSED